MENLNIQHGKKGRHNWVVFVLLPSLQCNHPKGLFPLLLMSNVFFR